MSPLAQKEVAVIVTGSIQYPYLLIRWRHFKLPELQTPQNSHLIDSKNAKLFL